MEEKRKYPRRRAGYSAVLTSSERPSEKIRIHDISMGGLFIESPVAGEPGETVTINIDSYDFGKDISITGSVIRSINGLGIGIKILSTTNDDFLREWLTR
jgi:hypothetical protein